MEEQKAVFDMAREISITLPVATGDKKVAVRFPTDEEWIKRGAKRRLLIKRGGELEPLDSPEADLELLSIIRILEDDGNGAISHGPEFDGDEAGQVLERISRVAIEEVTREGNAYRVRLEVPGGITEHLLRVPSAKEIKTFRSGWATVRPAKHGRQEISIDLNAAGKLYKELCQNVAGYPSTNGSGPSAAVPIVHQAAAVQAAIEEMEAAVCEDSRETF